MNLNNIFIATSSFAVHSDKPLDTLDKHQHRYTLNSFGKKLSGKELLTNAKNSYSIIAGTEIYDEHVLMALPNLKVISRLGVGMDNIDLEFAKKRGIKVFRTKTTPAPAVAELVLGLMIDIARKVTKQHGKLTDGIWKKEMGVLLQGKTLGIIGLGTIGKALVKLVKGFNFNILAYDLYQDESFQSKNNITYCDLDTLLKESDIVSIHLNLSDQTKNMMNKQRLGQMKPDSILINASRGEIIDEDALYDILKGKKIIGAGLDVFREEPYRGPLTELYNVVLTPHIGSYAKELRIQMEIEAVENLIKGLNEA
jgi:D-3-phosphoglycerate dehydrogenase / 2-oxoglutarate reductase